MSAELPLYKGDHDAALLSPWGAQANTGLYWSKFLRSHEPIKGEEGWKTAVVKGAAGRAVGSSTALEEAKERLSALILARGGFEYIVQSRTNFVTGLGIEHPLENGFTWHATLGTPYLPGSSLKGLARSWATTWKPEVPQADIDRIFGPLSQAEPKAAGSVIFLDAVPTSPPRLHADIINPHYSDYYKAGNTNDAPGDWLSPIPVPLLTVAKGLSLLGGVLPRRPGTEQDVEDAKVVRDWLKDAFEFLGAGAKTAKGYGRFEIDQGAVRKAERARLEHAKEREAQQELKRRTIGKSAIYAEYLLDAKKHAFETDKDYFAREGLKAWLDRLEENQDPDVCQELEKLVGKHFKEGILENPSDPKYKVRQVELVNRLLAIKQSLGI